MPIISGLKVAAATIGNSATDTQNFQLSANNDGTMKLARKSDGTGGDIMTVDAAGKVGFPTGMSLNQTWQDMTASRALVTNYTNNTGKDIQIMVTCSCVGPAIMQFTVGAVSPTSAYSAGTTVTGGITVPSGAVYQCLAGSSKVITAWYELR